MKIWIAMMLAAMVQGAWAQSRLPPCPGRYAANKWSNCFGSHMTETAARYDGEWVNDRFEGFGC